MKLILILFLGYVGAFAGSALADDLGTIDLHDRAFGGPVGITPPVPQPQNNFPPPNNYPIPGGYPIPSGYPISGGIAQPAKPCFVASAADFEAQTGVIGLVNAPPCIQQTALPVGGPPLPPGGPFGPGQLEYTLNFGGMYGYVNGQPHNNVATGAASCPTGYTAVQILNTTNVDWPLFFCYQTWNPATPPIYDFGGMYGTASGQPVNNPITGAQSCPPNYQSDTVYGAPNVDYPLTYCYLPHVAGTNAQFDFGGMWGYINAGTATANPATGGQGCPNGQQPIQVLGTSNVDWPVYYCFGNP